MIITYVAPAASEISAEDTSVNVIYTNESGFIYNRSINVPRIEGTIDEDYYQEILEGQLLGVENKIKVGAVTFVDPSAAAEDAENPGE